MTKIAVLGCGPAGLLTAHAVAVAGYKPVIYSVKTRSNIGGAQYLHSRIVGLTSTEADGKVEFVKLGERDVYAEKIYGDLEAPTSWEEFDDGIHEVWNLQAAYQRLWNWYHEFIVDVSVTAQMALDLLTAHDLVLSTIPPTAYCMNPEHQFIRQRVWITEEQNCGEMVILYSGDPEVAWYRASNLWGHTYTEYAYYPGQPAVKVNKPLRTDCNCYSGIVRLGRYGRWEKRQLSHDAYFGALGAINAL
jgi:hypothetical protein